MDSIRLEHIAPFILRLGLAVLYLWFGMSEVAHPADWIAWVPPWASQLSGLSEAEIVLTNGLFETIAGLFLLAGFFTRWAALLLALHLFVIAFSVGYNDTGVRDFTLAIATLSLTLGRPDRYTLDTLRTKTAVEYTS